MNMANPSPANLGMEVVPPSEQAILNALRGIAWVASWSWPPRPAAGSFSITAGQFLPCCAALYFVASAFIGTSFGIGSVSIE